MKSLLKSEHWSKCSRLLLFIVALLIAVLLWTLSIKQAMPELNSEKLKSAKALWTEMGPKRYTMEVEISGVQHGHHHIVVEHGVVVSMTTDGYDVPKSAWEYWNVEGMFRFLAEELIQASHPGGGFGAPDPEKIYLSANFDATLGYPREYLRQVFGANVTIHWLVTLHHN